MRHFFRFEDAGMDRSQLNLVADLVVNLLVHSWPIPVGSITLQSFPQLGLRPNKSVEHYYKSLERGIRLPASRFSYRNLLLDTTVTMATGLIAHVRDFLPI